MPSIPSIISPLAPEPSTCGYCSPSGQRSQQLTSYHAACLMSMSLTCEVYQKMIDRGWRRAGEYCYKPDMKRCCCPQYTIRLDALELKPTKSQRKLVNRFNRWILYGDEHEDKKQKGKANDAFVLERAIHHAEHHRVCVQEKVQSQHRFEVTLEPSSFTDEKFALYQRYQLNRHKEEIKKPSTFKRFLVDSPLLEEPIPYTSDSDIPEDLPRNYGSYHQMYRIDGDLVAVGVLDILPRCVSSVYFMYDQQWEKFSLGKLSALREVALVREMHNAGATDVGWSYMGYYVHSCAKMLYKAEYAPSYFADPEEYSWHRLEDCIPLMEKNRYACFARPEHSIQGDYVGPPLSPSVPASLMDTVLYIDSVTPDNEVNVKSITNAPEYIHSSSARHAIQATAEALGEEVVKDTCFYLKYQI